MATTTDPAAAASERALFEKAMTAAGAPSAKTETADKSIEKAPVGAAKDTRVKPEEIWRTGQAAKDKAAAAKAKAEPARGDDGKFVAAEPETFHVEQSDDEPDPQTDEWKNALRANGLRAKEINAMDADELARRGAKALKKKQADDEAHSLAKQLREKKDDGKETKNPARVLLDLDPVVTPLATSLALDEAGAKTLKQTFEQFASLVSKQAVEPLSQKLEEFERRQAESAKANEARAISVAQVEVGKRFPDLLDPDTFQSVLEEVAVLSNSKKYQRIANPQERVNLCFQDACERLELRSDEDASNVQTAPKEDRSRSRSTVSDRTRPLPVSPMEKDRAWFDQIAAKHEL